MPYRSQEQLLEELETELGLELLELRELRELLSDGTSEPASESISESESSRLVCPKRVVSWSMVARE